MKKLAYAAVFIIVLMIFILIKNNSAYQIKIEVECNNYSASKMDEIVAEEFKDNLSQIEELDEIYIISKENTTNIYCRVKPFTNKNNVINKIEQRIEKAKKGIDTDTQITLDSEYDSIYQVFFIVYGNNINYNILKKYSDIVLDRLLGLKISSKILTVSDIEKCAYIYFSDSTLVKYNINLADIKDFIEKNNLKNDSNAKNTNLNSYEINTNCAIRNIDDVKNLALNYLNKDFSINFGDIFDIKEDIKTPSDSYTFLDDNKAAVFAISKKKYYPRFLIDYKLKKLQKNIGLPTYIKTKILNTDKLEKIEVYFDNNTSIFNTINEYKKIKDTKDTLFFIGIDAPRISYRDKLFEKQKNKLTILTPSKAQFENVAQNMTYTNQHNKVIYLENEDLNRIYRDIEQIKEPHINNSINKSKKISYDIDNYALGDYLTDKTNIMYTIFALYNGLECSYYYDSNSVKTPIVLKNTNDQKRAYFYSKNLKNLIYLGSTAKSSLEEDFNIITRKNDKYFAKIIIK